VNIGGDTPCHCGCGGWNQCVGPQFWNRQAQLQQQYYLGNQYLGNQHFGQFDFPPPRETVRPKGFSSWRIKPRRSR